MSFTLDQQVTPEKIRETVNQIVESLSQMVMDCIRGDIQHRIKPLCTQLVTSSNELITFGKLTAVDDPAFAVAVTNQIKATHTCVGKFIDAFVQLVRSPEDQQVNVIFSQVSKQFADNIIALTDIIDPTSSPRMAIVMRKTVLDLSSVEKLCSVDWPQKDPIVESCKQFEQSSKLLILCATMALNISVAEPKRVLFDQALDALEQSAVTFLDNARKFSKDPHDPMNSEYQRLALQSGKDFGSGVTTLIQAVQEEDPSPFQKFFAAIVYIQVLIVKAKKLSKATLILDHLVTVETQEWDEISEITHLVSVMLHQTMEVTKEVMTKETDPTKRALLEGCIWDFEDIIPEFSVTCDAYQGKEPVQPKHEENVEPEQNREEHIETQQAERTEERDETTQFKETDQTEEIQTDQTEEIQTDQTEEIEEMGKTEEGEETDRAEEREEFGQGEENWGEEKEEKQGEIEEMLEPEQQEMGGELGEMLAQQEKNEEEEIYREREMEEMPESEPQEIEELNQMEETLEKEENDQTEEIEQIEKEENVEEEQIERKEEEEEINEEERKERCIAAAKEKMGVLCKSILRVIKKIHTGVDDHTLNQTNSFLNLGTLALTNLDDKETRELAPSGESAFAYAAPTGTLDLLTFGGDEIEESVY